MKLTPKAGRTGKLPRAKSTGMTTHKGPYTGQTPGKGRTGKLPTAPGATRRKSTG